MAISFAPDGAVRVEAPPGTTLNEVQGLLTAHERWVRHRSRVAAENAVYWYPAEYDDGAVLFFHGRPVVLRLGAGDSVELAEGELKAPAQGAKRAVWPGTASRRTRCWARPWRWRPTRCRWVKGVPPWRHRYMKSRWGSCSTSGRVSLNTHLVKLPAALIEYVVLHELCHMRHMNHSPPFYELLAAYLPAWKDRRRELGHHAGLLSEPLP